jgi:hypothetical protein
MVAVVAVGVDVGVPDDVVLDPLVLVVEAVTTV